MSIRTICTMMTLILLPAAMPTIYAQNTDTTGQTLLQQRDTAVTDTADTDTAMPPIPAQYVSVIGEATPPVKQGLLVVSDNPDCEVLINGTNRGKGEQVFIALAPGTYTVSGHLEEGFDDYEQESVEQGTVTTVTVNPRVVRVKADPFSYYAVITRDMTMHGTGIGAGVWYKNHLFNPFYAVCCGSGWSNSDHDSTIIRKYGTSTISTIGVHYLYNAVANDIVQFGIGVSTAWGVQAKEIDLVEKAAEYQYFDQQRGLVEDTSIQITSEYSRTSTEFISLGPRIAIQAGLEHVKLLVAGTYMIRSDAKGVVADPRNFYLLQAGITLLF